MSVLNFNNNFYKRNLKTPKRTFVADDLNCIHAKFRRNPLRNDRGDVASTPARIISQWDELWKMNPII